MAYAQVEDVVERFERPLDADEEAVVQRRLDDAELLLLLRIPDLHAKVTAGDISEDLVVMIEADAVLALIRNPDAKVGETDGNYCLHPQSNILCSDLTWRPLGSLHVGDPIIGFDETYLPGSNFRKFRRSTITDMGRASLPTYDITFTDGRVIRASDKHMWLGKERPTSPNLAWRTSQSLSPGDVIKDLGTPWAVERSREAGYLAGIYDGEGSIDSTAGFRVSFPQRPGSVMERVKHGMKSLGFPIGDSHLQKNGVEVFYLTGVGECMRFLGSVQPTRMLENSPALWEGKSLHFLPWATVSGITPVGDTELVTVGTSTKTLFVEGLASHNSYQLNWATATGRLIIPDEHWVLLGVKKSIYTIAPKFHAVDELYGPGAYLPRSLYPWYVGPPGGP